MALLTRTPEGLFCPAGAFYIDPWRPVDRAVVTHGHADHARWGCDHYLAAQSGLGILRRRLGAEASLQGVAYGERIEHNGVGITLYPAGHLLGSAQVCVEQGGERWVVSGDYKWEPDSTCEPFEPVPCHTFITESTFGLPIYRWPRQAEVFAQINQWWRRNQEQGRTSMLFAYALGKAQRLLAGLESSIGPILVHGAVAPLVQCYREAGIALPEVLPASPENAKAHKGRAMVVAPPSAMGTPWMRKFQPYSTAFASGWMQIRGTRRRRALDRGFVISDHVDWIGLQQAVHVTGAARIGVTHGYTSAMVRWLREQGYEAWAIETRFEGELESDSDSAPAQEETT